jgi:hypothetical protein
MGYEEFDVGTLAEANAIMKYAAVRQELRRTEEA